MSLKHILLGLLNSPHSGYDVKKQFDTSLRNFWKAELSQIYPTLQKLEGDGLLRSKSANSSQGPKRVVYERTTAGKKALLDWLEDGPVVGTERIACLAQIYFLAELGDKEATLDFLQQLRTYFHERLAQLRAVETGWSTDDPRYPDALPDEDFYPQLTLDFGLRRIAATVEWCDITIERVRNRGG